MEAWRGHDKRSAFLWHTAAWLVRSTGTDLSHTNWYGTKWTLDKWCEDSFFYCTLIFIYVRYKALSEHFFSLCLFLLQWHDSVKTESLFPLPAFGALRATTTAVSIFQMLKCLNAEIRWDISWIHNPYMFIQFIDTAIFNLLSGGMGKLQKYIASSAYLFESSIMTIVMNIPNQYSYSPGSSNLII